MKAINDGPKIRQEMRTVSAMIHLYCRKKHGGKDLCEECADLERYAHTRLSHCRFGEEKGTCEKCQVHCYRKDYRERIKAVMRFSGPRMLTRHPIWAIRHLIKNLKSG
ncbi:nitrous oxide-stimulated promoter family protein [Listeria costaricensis]|uniref:nitrous oxide-stimulated promoter family protein n=1 Tax=Listeria costaricensis TaxID=2026604 RepID=UPI000C085185|nr:nitrous oxide-stimulated promoter family protein [Listeria costaricensis]